MGGERWEREQQIDRTLADLVREVEAVTQRNDELVARVAALEARLVAVEPRPRPAQGGEAGAPRFTAR